MRGKKGCVEGVSARGIFTLLNKYAMSTGPECRSNPSVHTVHTVHTAPTRYSIENPMIAKDLNLAYYIL